jgi:hypothetical protein
LQQIITIDSSIPATVVVLAITVLCGTAKGLMSALGQKRTLKCFHPMSALPPKADIDERAI